MKIKCVVCKKEDELMEEDTKLLAHVIKKYNDKPRPTDYTEVLSIIKGNNCVENKRCIWIFHEDFDNAVAGTLKDHKDAIAANVARKETLEKVYVSITETTNQIKSLESALKDLEKKKEYILSEMNTGGMLIENIKLEFMKLTGTDDTTIWS